MGELKLNTIRLNTVSLNTMPINSIDFKKKASSSASGDVDENGYIIFADTEVARICAENWGDGTGITKAQAAAVTSIGTVFKDNKNITKFNELRYFANVKDIPELAFHDCSNLLDIDLSNIESIGYASFFKCSSLAIELDCPKLKFINGGAFRGSGITKIANLGVISTLPFREHGVFQECVNLQEVVLPNTLIEIGRRCFLDCRSLKNILLPEGVEIIGDTAFNSCEVLKYIGLPSTLTKIWGWCFDNNPLLNVAICKAEVPPASDKALFVSVDETLLIYVPSYSVEAYRTATHWRAYASRIFPIWQLATDNPELYAEIKEYLGNFAKLFMTPSSVTVTSPTLKLTTYYDGVEVTPEYLIEETDVATIDGDGTITFLKEGSVTVIAHYNNESARETYKYIIADFAIDKYFTPSSATDVSYIENTNIKLFSDDYPLWTLKLSASNVNYDAMGSDAALAACNDESGTPWPGLYYGRHGGNYTIRFDINPGNTLIFNSAIPQAAIIRRNNNIVEYSLDGSRYMTAISDLSSILAQKPRLAECPLIVGGYYDNNGNVGRPAYGHIKAELWYSVEDLEID